MRQQVIKNSVFQAVGMLCMIGTTLLVARVGGAVDQGSFALIKSATDLQVGLFSLGMPPAIIFALNKCNYGHGDVTLSSIKYTLILILVNPILNFLYLYQLGGAEHWGQIFARSVLIGWAGALLTGFALLRSLVLLCTDGLFFSIISILHWIIILFGSVILLNRTNLAFEVCYFVAGLFCFSLALYFLLTRDERCRFKNSVQPADWTLIRRQSVHFFLQASLYAFLPFATLSFLAKVDITRASAGYFNIASMAVTIPNQLIAMVAPILYNRWSRDLNLNGYRAVRRGALKFAVCLQVVSLFGIFISDKVLVFIFGSDFAPAVTAVNILLFSVFAVIMGRILTSALQGLGRNIIVTLSCVARVCATFLALAILYYIEIRPVSLVALSWVVGEYCALFVLVVYGLPRKRISAMTEFTK